VQHGQHVGGIDPTPERPDIRLIRNFSIIATSTTASRRSPTASSR
jgi:hypothetical protein